MRLVKKLIAVASAMILGILLTSTSSPVKADSSHEQNTYYDDNTTATICGTWGANLFNGNDSNKTFNRILPRDSQWQVYGYTWRGDGYYYYAGGNLWIQANQAKIPVSNDADAILNVVSRITGETAYPGWHWVGYWWEGGNTINVFQTPLSDVLDDSNNYFDQWDQANYLVQPNGDVYRR